MASISLNRVLFVCRFFFTSNRCSAPLNWQKPEVVCVFIWGEGGGGSESVALILVYHGVQTRLVT